MGARHTDRLWMGAGALLVLLLTVGAYFLLIKPQYDEANALREQTDSARSQAAQLQKRIVELKKEQENLTSLTATLTNLQLALPSDDGGPALLRQLADSGTALGVDVSGMTMGDPVDSTTVSGLKEIPIQLTVTGTADKLETFLEQLQGGTQKRAVLIAQANLGVSTSGSSGDANAEKGYSINLTLTAFQAATVSADAPAVTTTD